MSVTQTPVVPTLRERVAAAVAEKEAEERERAETADRNARGDAQARLVNRLRDILGIVLTDSEPLDWTGWPRQQPTVTVEGVTFHANPYGAAGSHSWQLSARFYTGLPLEEWVPVRSLTDLHPILAELDAVEARS